MDENQLAGERLLSLPDVPDYLPRRHGKKLHLSTVHRWVRKGARGKVLDSMLVGGVRYTSLEALERFLGTSTSELVELRRHEQVRARLECRGLASVRNPEDRLPGRDAIDL